MTELRIAENVTSLIPLRNDRVVRLRTDAGILTIHWQGFESFVLHEEEEPWLPEDEVSKQSNVSEELLRKVRYHGDGPEYLHRGHSILYKLSTVRNWVEKRSRV